MVSICLINNFVYICTISMKKKILIFTGAGVSAESGVKTFRDADGLWYNHKIEDVASPEGWRRDKETVLEFYNQRRRQLKEVEPNDGHRVIAELEKSFDVTLVTQNVDNLHERAGSTNVIHLHGELTKVRSTLNPNFIYDWEDDLNLGDKCERGSQLRPHIVWFGEMLDPRNIAEAEKAANDCDFCIIVGTSMKVAPANQIPFLTKEGCFIYYVDPSDIGFYVPEYRNFRHIQDLASVGMQKVKDELSSILLNDVTDII